MVRGLICGGRNDFRIGSMSCKNRGNLGAAVLMCALLFLSAVAVVILVDMEQSGSGATKAHSKACAPFAPIVVQSDTGPERTSVLDGWLGGEPGPNQANFD